MAKAIKLTAIQKHALERLTEAGKPVTSQELCVQIKTLQALKTLGLVSSQEISQNGRDCESIHWQITPQGTGDVEEKTRIVNNLRGAIQEAESFGLVRLENGDVITGAQWSEHGLVLVKE